MVLPADTDLLAMHRTWPQRYTVLLESAASGGRQACWDILHVHDGGGIVLDHQYHLHTLDGDPLDGGFLAALDAQWRAAGPLPAHRDVPFQGGWALYLGYERSEEHTSELQSLMRLSYAVFCL